MSDLISRADAIERIANDNVIGGMDRINEYRNSNEHNDYLDGISCAIATVDDLPSADAVQGEWIKDYEKNIYKCSVCGCEEVVPTCMGETTIWKYCPNCGSVIGAKMKGGAE